MRDNVRREGDGKSAAVRFVRGLFGAMKESAVEEASGHGTPVRSHQIVARGAMNRHSTLGHGTLAASAVISLRELE